jgi:ribosomal-protein-serine acetyltransferase
MFQYLIDDEVSLRPFRIDDAPEMFELITQSKDHLRKWLGWVDGTQAVEDSAAFIKSTLQGTVENGGYPKTVAILYRGRIAGTIGFNEVNKTNRIGMIGYWLGEPYQGKGIMTKAVGAYLRYGFDDLGLNRIDIRAATGNHRSRALPLRFGFQEEGTIRQAEWLYDHYVDHVVYGLLKTEWLQRQQKAL